MTKNESSTKSIIVIVGVTFVVVLWIFSTFVSRGSL